MQKTDTFWLIAFSLGFLLTFAVIGVPIGLGAFLFFNALLGVIWYFAQKNEHRNELSVTPVSDIFIKALSVAYVVLSFPYLYRMDEMVLFPLVFAHLVLAVLLSVFVSLPGAVHIVEIFSVFITPISFAGNWIMETLKSITELFKGNANVVKIMLKFVMYAAVSLFVFILFSNLLSDADPEFKRRIQEILESLKLSEIMARTVGGVVVSFVVAGFITVLGYFSLLPMLGTNAERAKEQWKKAFSFALVKRSDSLFPLIITLPMFSLFALYVWVQTKYLFGQDMSQILAKYTFAEYAHRGFIELLVVGVLSYPILSWTMNRMRTEWAIARVANFLTNTGIVALLVIMLYSLYLRMDVYMSSYGPSVLRTYVLIGAAFVGLALLAYEVVAVLKAAKPGYTFMNSLVIGDYSVLALFTGLGLLGAIALFPWNNYVVNEIEAHYQQNKKVDIFQLIDISDEAQPAVYKFAEKLEKDGAVDGAKILQLHALQSRDSYKKIREESLFTRLFGINVAGENLIGFASVNLADVTKSTSNYLSQRVNLLEKVYFDSLEANDFEKARSVFDPAMKNNDIVGFAQHVTVEVKRIGLSSQDGDTLLFTNGSRFMSRTNEVFVTRSPVIGAIKQKTTDSAYLSLTIGLRNGQLVAVDSALILTYLPDAVVGADNLYDSTVSTYGYQTFCEIPTLAHLYSPTENCSSEGRMENLDSPMKPYSMQLFERSDFVTSK